MCAVANARADDSKVEVTGEVAVASTYLWRGINYHDDLFEPAAQPYAQVQWRGVTAGMWVSVPIRDQSATADEYDPYLMYTRALGPVNLELLYWVFVLPDFDPADTGHLVQATVGHRWISAGASYDPIREGGAYYFAAADDERTVGPVVLKHGARVGASHGGGQDFGLQDVTAYLGGTYPLGATAYTSATVTVAYGPRMPAGDRIIPALVFAVGFSR